MVDRPSLFFLRNLNSFSKKPHCFFPQDLTLLRIYSLFSFSLDGSEESGRIGIGTFETVRETGPEWRAECQAAEIRDRPDRRGRRLCESGVVVCCCCGEAWGG